MINLKQLGIKLYTVHIMNRIVLIDSVYAFGQK